MRSFFGESRHSIECGGIRASDSTYSVRLELPRHSHPRAHLCLVLSGDYMETLSGVREPRGPMTLIYYPPECPHAELHRASGRHFLVEWDEEWVRRIGIESELPGGPVVVNRLLAVFAALRMFRLLHGQRAAPPCELEEALVVVLTELDEGPTRFPRRAPKWLRSVIERLHESPVECLTLVDLAQEARVHPSHLARTFKRFAGCTPGEMRRRFQVERACRELAARGDALCHVAVDTGFADQSHMTRAVREATGFTPQALRSASATPQPG